MVTGTRRANLDAKTILKSVSEYDIYRFYLGEDFTIGKVMQSPMPGRRDLHPSFCIKAKDNTLLHMDFADSSYSGNCFQFVMQKEMVGYHEALRKIDRDFGLGISSGSVITTKRPVFIQPKIEDSEPKIFQVQYTSKMTAEEIAYWDQFYITPEELKDNDIYAVRKYWIDRQLQGMRKGELTFGYRFDNLWKIYRPYACKDRKWKSNVPLSMMYGLENLKKEGKNFITKSKKDYIVFKKFLSENCSGTQNESSAAISKVNIELFNSLESENYIVFDNDDAGIKASIYYNQFGFKYWNIPNTFGVKDVSDFVKKYGPDKLFSEFSKKIIL